MNLNGFLASKMVSDLGHVLIDSVWQIVIIAGSFYLLLAVTRKASANLRYAAGIAAMFLCLAVPTTNFIVRSSATGPVVESSGDPDDPRLSGRNETAMDVPSRSEMGVRIAQSTQKPTLLLSVSSVREYLPIDLSTLVALWLCGIAISTLRLIGGLRHVSRSRKTGISSPDDGWQKRFADLRDRLQVTKRVRLVISDLISTPVAAGIVKPLIIVPASVFLQMSPGEIETIIMHELVHIRRYDPLVNLLQNFAEAVLFYHPCVWWISREVRREREFAADAAVVGLLNGSHVVYASALANLEAVRQSANMDTPRLAAAANGGNLMVRIQKILGQKNAEVSRAGSAWTAGLTLVLISAVLLSVFLFTPEAGVNAQDSKRAGRKIAIGFVGIPPVDRTADAPKDSASTAKILIEVMKQHHVQATGFVNGGSISDGTKLFPVRAEIVRMWRDEGFDVGVGGFRHIWFYETPYDDYVANTEKAIRIVEPILAEKGQQLKYFSYPYLNTGKTNEDHNRYENWLHDRGLSSVKYTIDNSEWMYSYAYDVARNDNDVNTMKEVREAFIDYMARMFDHYEGYSRQMFGRDIAQTMVLTPSRLVADTGHELFGMLEKRGYTFISIADAQSDPAYQQDEDFAGKAGISWFERWQMKKGRPLLDEPKVDARVENVWNRSRSK